MHDSSEIKNKISEISRKRLDLRGIAYGRKMSDGKNTNELSIVFFVEKKKPLSELSESEIIPSKIQLNSGEIKTDVREIGKTIPLACNANCGQAAGSNSLANRVVQRPLRGGLSITSTNNVSTVGTMGFIAVHSATQTLVGVTNNHVTIQDAFFTGERNLFGVLKNEYSPIDYIYQNGESGIIPPSNYIIGQSLRYVPIYKNTFLPTTPINRVDGAIFSLRPADIASDSFKQIGEEYYTAPYPFATTAEIDNLLTTNPMLYSSGRTTGPKGGASCPMRISFVNLTTTSTYTLQGVYTSVYFEDLLQFVKPENDPNISTICPNPIRGGDSGSALIADFGGVRKIIGLVFAGQYDQFGQYIIYGVACRIDKVAQELGIEAWDGTPKNFVNPATIDYKTVPGGNFNKTLNCNGKTYWQVGLTNISNPC